MKQLCCGIAMIIGIGLATSALADDGYSLSAADWSRPRSAQSVAAMPAVHAAVNDWLAHPGTHLVIEHAGGDNGVLWASELEDWLVSMGIPSSKIVSRVGNETEDKVRLLVEK